MEGEWGNSGPAYFLLSFFLISHSFLNSIISCIFKNKIVSRKWISELVGFKLSYIEIIGFFLAEHWDQLVGIIYYYWLYFFLINLTSNTIQVFECWLSGKSVEIWFQTKFRMKICLHSTILGERAAIKKTIMMLFENCSKFAALLCILVGVLVSRRIVKLSKASGWYWHTINLKGLPTLP